MNNQFSENLKRIRKEHNMSQEQLADELGVSRQAISKWESSIAYPEMDKIIALCDKFNLNIDDLLHKDIKEVKGEEESKKKLNNYLDDFLKFITDTINLFSNMNFKSKIKCLVEQAIIIAFLILISAAIILFGDELFFNLFSFIPNIFSYFIRDFLSSILVIFCAIFSLIILSHVFKTRYLDYYNKLKKDLNDENLNQNDATEDNEPETKEVSQENNIHKQNKILFRRNENKIIIRDPSHSEYRFINGLFKFIVGIIKFLAGCFALGIIFILITLFFLLIISFLVYKTGLFFVGLLVSILSSSIITIIFLLIILNFIFNRKNAKKTLIWSFILSLSGLGIGLGLTFIGTLDFEIINNTDLLKTETLEFSMQDYTYLNLLYYDDSDITYVESNIDNIKVEAKINPYCQLYFNEHNYSSGINIWSECQEPLKIAKEFITNLNNKRIIYLDNKLQDIVIYASKENIAKMQTNKNNTILDHYAQRITDLEAKINDYENKIFNYEATIAELNSRLNEYNDYVDE